MEPEGTKNRFVLRTNGIFVRQGESVPPARVNETPLQVSTGVI